MPIFDSFYDKNSNTYSESINKDRLMLSSGKMNFSKNVSKIIPCYQEAFSIIQKIKTQINSVIAPPETTVWKDDKSASCACIVSLDESTSQPWHMDYCPNGNRIFMSYIFFF